METARLKYSTSSTCSTLVSRCSRNFTLSCHLPFVKDSAAASVVSNVLIFRAAGVFPWAALAAAAAVAVCACAAATCLVRKKYAKYAVANRCEQRTSVVGGRLDCPTYNFRIEAPSRQISIESPRIRIPDPPPKQQQQQQQQQHGGGLRPRLESVLVWNSST